MLGHSYLLYQGLVHLEGLPQLKVVCVGLAEATHHLEKIRDSYLRGFFPSELIQMSQTCIYVQRYCLFERKSDVCCLLSVDSK